MNTLLLCQISCCLNSCQPICSCCKLLLLLLSPLACCVHLLLLPLHCTTILRLLLVSPKTNLLKPSSEISETIRTSIPAKPGQSLHKIAKMETNNWYEVTYDSKRR